MILIIFLLFGLFPFVNAAINLAIDRGMNDKMLFSKYRIWLAKKSLGKLAKRELSEIQISVGEKPDYSYEEITDLASEKGKWFYKPFGGCVHCMAIWVSVPAYVLLNILFRHLFELGLMPYDLYILEYWHILIWIAYASISDLLIDKLY